MSSTRNSSDTRKILPPVGAHVKAKIIAAGLTLRQVAGRAGMAQSTLSDYLAGRIRNVHGQIDVLLAFTALTGESMTVREFWGSLTAEEAA